jgi:hypothetical protein
MARHHTSRILIAVVLIVFGSMIAAADAQQPELPLERVVMFTSGVGYYEHSATIDGDRKLELKFNVDDINDVLKSIVLEDSSGGQVAALTYAAKDPITKTLRTFAIDLTHEPTVTDLLRQVRGEKVEVETRGSGDQRKITGAILGIERRVVSAPKGEPMQADVLNLVTKTGLRSVPMEDIVDTRLLDERLNADLQYALTILASAHITSKKTVTLHFQGKEKRKVRVGYVLDSPLWKTSYRLVLGEDRKPLLQGWAIVENTTEHDWKDVSMALVSGRPNSFQMNLYQPYYVARPTVAPTFHTSVPPQMHEQDLYSQDARFREKAVAGQKPLRAAGEPLQGGLGGSMGGGMGGAGGGMGMGGGGGGMFGEATMAAAAARHISRWTSVRALPQLPSAAMSASCFDTRSPTPSTSTGRSRRCYRSSTTKSAASGCRFITRSLIRSTRLTR